jgi:hypothetical protein
MFRGLFNPRIIFPVLLVLGAYLVIILVQDRSGKQAADDSQRALGRVVPFNYVTLRGGEYMLAKADVTPPDGLSDADMLEEGFKNPPEGYLPIAGDALIKAITAYDNAVEIDFTAHPCPGEGERERLTAIAWTVGDFFNAEFVRIKVNGITLEEIVN